MFFPVGFRLRQCKYLNNVVEQDHRTVKKPTWLAEGYGSFLAAWRTLQGIKAVNMIRQGRARWVAKEDAIAQATFMAELLASPRNSEIDRAAPNHRRRVFNRISQ